VHCEAAVRLPGQEARRALAGLLALALVWGVSWALVYGLAALVMLAWRAR
jgi:hypothetical protein